MKNLFPPIFTIANVSSINLSSIFLDLLRLGSFSVHLISSLVSDGNCVAIGFTFFATIFYFIYAIASSLNP